MKNVILTLAFMLVGTFAFANNTAIESTEVEGYVEYMVVKNDKGEDTCYARFCW